MPELWVGPDEASLNGNRGGNTTAKHDWAIQTLALEFDHRLQIRSGCESSAASIKRWCIPLYLPGHLRIIVCEYCGLQRQRTSRVRHDRGCSECSFLDWRHCLDKVKGPNVARPSWLGSVLDMCSLRASVGKRDVGLQGEIGL